MPPLRTNAKAGLTLIVTLVLNVAIFLTLAVTLFLTLIDIGIEPFCNADFNPNPVPILKGVDFDTGAVIDFSQVI